MELYGEKALPRRPSERESPFETTEHTPDSPDSPGITRNLHAVEEHVQDFAGLRRDGLLLARVATS